MKKPVYIAPSTDPISDYQEIIEYAKSLQGVADFLHCDVMDGMFVPKKNYNSSLVKQINDNALIPLDVHLMVDEPADVLEDYIFAGANILTIHYEAFKDKNKLFNSLAKIKKNKILAGLSLKPDTTLKEAKNFLYTVDVVLLMSVEPGESGQSFIPKVMDKIKTLDKFRKDNNLSFKIEVDGGINETNYQKLINLGVDILVSGSYVFKSSNREEVIEKMRNI